MKRKLFFGGIGAVIVYCLGFWQGYGKGNSDREEFNRAFENGEIRAVLRVRKGFGG